MANNAPFGRPGASDRLRLWWQGTSKTSRQNALLFVVVGSISAALVWAGVSRDAARTRGVATSARPPVSGPGLLIVPTTVDLRAVGTTTAPVEVADTTSTTATTSGAVTSATTARASSPTPAVTTSTPPAPATTVPTSDVIFTVVPPTTAPAFEPTLPPLPSSSVPTPTIPPTSAPPATSAPPTSSPPTTSGTGLPQLPLEIPRLVGGSPGS